MENKKKFWNTKVGQVLKKAAPAAVDIIGDMVPGGEILKTIFDNEVEQSETLADVEKEKLKAEFENALREYELYERKMLLDDTANARAMQIEALRQDDKFSKRFIYFFASFWAVFSSIYILFITFGNVPDDNQRFADTILGFLLGTIISAVVQFFFGSSSGSKLKDEELIDSIRKK